MLINIRLANPLQACTAAGGRSSDLEKIARTLSFDLLQMVSHVVLPRFLQNIGHPHLLYRIHLHDYRASFRDVPAPGSGFDDDHQGDGDKEAGIGPSNT